MPKLKCQFKEMKRFERNLLELSRDVSKILKPAVYDGAGVAATALRETVGGLACVSDVDSIHAWRASTPTIICRSQKDGLLEALGVAKMKARGFSFNTRTGFDGYNSIVTRRWPNGQPNVMIAASCEHGSSAMLAQPFIRPAYKLCATEVRKIMEETTKKKIEEILDQS